MTSDWRTGILWIETYTVQKTLEARVCLLQTRAFLCISTGFLLCVKFMCNH